MRKKATRTQAVLEQKLNSIRNSMAEKVAKASKNGNSQKCAAGRERENNSSQARNTYCEENFALDYTQFQSCLDVENYCYTPIFVIKSFIFCLRLEFY